MSGISQLACQGRADETISADQQDSHRNVYGCLSISHIVAVGRQVGVRRDSAVKLIDGLAGESPVSADYPVGTVVISGDGAGDQTVGSPDVNVLDGWTQVWSAPTGGQAKQQVVA